MATSLDPNEIKRVKLHPVKCPKCKANLMIRPTEKVCPVVGVRCLFSKNSRALEANPAP